MTRRPSFWMGGSLLTWAAVLTLVVLVGCGSGATSPGPSGGPTPDSSGVGDVDHPTGSTTVILRLDEGGGLVPPGFFVTEAPAFSLYGDGVAIFRDPAAQRVPAAGSIIPGVPFQAVRLSQGEVQALLAFALGPGALRTARAHYELPVADAPTTTFTILAGGVNKTVRVNGLAVGADFGPDAEVLDALAKLRTRLLAFGSSITGEMPWIPERYRGVLMEAVGGDQSGSPIPWPWTTIAPADFVLPADPSAPGWPTRVMSPAEVTALGVDGLEGGAQGFLLRPPPDTRNATLFRFALRPLLPDEPR